MNDGRGGQRILFVCHNKIYLNLFFLYKKQLYYFNYSYIAYITATENNLKYSYIYSYITYVVLFCFLQIRMLQWNTIIFKTILVDERLNKITIYFKRKEKKKQKRLQCIECTTYKALTADKMP